MIISARKLTVLLVIGALTPWLSAAEWKSHVVRQLGGTDGEVHIPARLQIVTEEINSVVLVPYLVYMPEKDRLLMLVTFQPGPTPAFHAMVITSEDHGTTWSEPAVVQRGADGAPTNGLGLSLSYLGQGELLLHLGDPGVRMFSRDYGANWGNPVPVQPTPEGKPFHVWDPLLVEYDDQSAAVTRLLETGWTIVQPPDKSPSCEQAYLRSSADKGRTWSECTRVPQWQHVSEVALLRTATGDLLAACRSSIPPRFAGETVDHHEGLGISVSKDGGHTWSAVKKLYDWGRHHPSLVLMPGGDVVMTYVVRMGYVDTPEGYPQFGIEAVVSHDHGQTWDLDHRYLLHRWEATMKGFNALYQSPQGVSSVLLPDGKMLTAFGTGYRSQGPGAGKHRRDIALVRWQLGEETLNDSSTMRDAPPASALRNFFDPVTGKPAAKQRNQE